MGDRSGARLVPALSRAAWKAIALRTLRHTLVSVIASVLVCYGILETFSGGIGRVGLVVSIIAPILLGAPMMVMMNMRHHQLREAYARLEAASRRDSLTGCLHHGAFVETVSLALATGGGALIIVDADHFKAVNDGFGHAVGDTALRLIAATITAHCPGDALVGRLGGEEFGVFLPGADAGRTRQTANAIRVAVAAISLEAGRSVCRLTVSMGAALSDGATGFDVLFREADAHLYKVKDEGRNNLSIATPGASLPMRTAGKPRPSRARTA